MIIISACRFSLAISNLLIYTTYMRSKLTLTHTKTGKVTYAVVRAASHDREPRIGMKGNHWGWPNTVITNVEAL